MKLRQSDDCIELEPGQTDSDGAGLLVHENLFMNSSVVWLSRRSPRIGPMYIYRNVLNPNDSAHGRGVHMIKTGGTAQLYLYFNTLISLNGMDHSTTFLNWGSRDAVTWNNDVDEVHMRNNAIIFEDGLQGTQPATASDSDHNLFYSRTDNRGLRGANGVFVNRSGGTSAIGFSNYGEDFTPVSGNLIDRAGAIPSRWNAPDNGWSTEDIGCFQTADPHIEDWPRAYDRSQPYSLASKHFETPRIPPIGWP